VVSNVLRLDQSNEEENYPSKYAIATQNSAFTLLTTTPDPLSAVITAEFASTKYRGGIIAAVFAMQGLGQLAAALVTLIVVIIFKDDLIGVANVGECVGQCAMRVDKMWRIIIAFGGIPGWFALYYRLTVPETPRYTFDVLYDVEKASVDARKYRYGKQGNVVNPVTQAKTRSEMAKYKTPRPTLMEVLRFYSQKKQAIRLFGTSMSWLYVRETRRYSCRSS